MQEATWASELVIDLKPIIKGKQEAGEDTVLLEEFVNSISSDSVKTNVVQRARDLGLGFFAQKLAEGFYDQRAAVANTPPEADEDTVADEPTENTDQDHDTPEQE